MRLIFRSLAGLGLFAGLLYVAAGGYLYAMQRTYVFHTCGELATPADEGLTGIEVVTLDASDGVKLTGWYAPAEPGRPTLLYFQGNAGSISERAPRYAEVMRAGFGFLAVSYRGFAGTDGSPSERALFADALTSFDWLAARTSDIVIHGESLGTGVATYVASRREARALVLESPFTATVDIAAETYPWLPVGWLMRDQFRTRDFIREVREPLLVLHGTDDRVVPVEHGRRLFALAGEPKELVIFEGGHHSDLWGLGLWAKEQEFLAKNGAAT